MHGLPTRAHRRGTDNFALRLRISCGARSMSFVQAPPYVPKNKTCLPAGRSAVVTTASLFDGHDAAINIPA